MAANSWDAQMAVKMGADCARAVGHEVGEDGDEAEWLEKEAWAEEMVARGVCDQRTALKCAEVVWELQRTKDARCAGGQTRGVVYAGPVPEGGEGARRLLQALSQVWAWPDSRKGLWALLFCLGRPPDGCETMRKCAKLRQTSPEDVSNVVERLQEILGVPRTLAQKSERAVESYKRTNGAK